MKVLIAGDFCPMNRVANMIESGCYESLFSNVKPVVEHCDYSIVNFECPIRITEGGGIKKAGPTLKCSAKSVDALKFAGFNCVTLANNHFYDQGEKGVNETIQTLNNAGVTYVGGGKNLEEASSTLYQEVKGKSLAIVNCCEHEFSIATDNTGGANPLNPIKQYYAIKEAKEKVDFLIVIVHGGIEHYQYPSQRMVDTYRFFVDAGADAVINHHQHCFSGAELWKGKPIFYGLGNFCFDWPERNNQLWVEGYMVELLLEKESIDYRLIPYIQNAVNPGVFLKNKEEQDEWKGRFGIISKVIQDEKKLQSQYESLLSKTERKFSIYLTPYTNKVALSLYMRHLLPRLMPQKRLRELLNMIRCESHRDRMIRMLESFTK